MILVMITHLLPSRCRPQAWFLAISPWVLGLWVLACGAAPHGGEEAAHETLEAVPFLVVTATAREAYLVTFLTDDLVDVETLTAEGDPPGLRALTREEIQRLNAADLVFLGRESLDGAQPALNSKKVIRMPEWPEPPAVVSDRATQGATDRPSKKKSKKTSVQPTPSLQPTPSVQCRNIPVFAPPKASTEIARELATVLAQRLPQMAEKIDRNLLFLNSELRIFDGLLKDLEAPAAHYGFLGPDCVYRLLAEDYHFAVTRVEWSASDEVTQEVFQRDCAKTRQSSCLVLRLDAPTRGIGGERTPSFKPPGLVLNAGLRKPVRANVFADYQAQLDVLRTLLSPPEDLRR